MMRAHTSRLCALLSACVMLVALVGVVTAQQSKGAERRVRFARGKTTATLTGRLRPGTSEARHEYVVRAKAGQTISVRVSSNKVRLDAENRAGAIFFVLDGGDRQPPDFGDYFYGGPTEWTGRLPKSGDWRVVVKMEDGPDDPDADALRRMRLVLPYRLTITVR